MPFTLSHPAAILPLLPWAGRRLSATALVIGSMAPDVEFFLRMRAETDISHTYLGALLFNVPVTVALAFLYHGWIREPLLASLPSALQKKLGTYNRFTWALYFRKNWPVVLLSALIGVASHYFCDAFTHDYGWFVQCIPLLSTVYSLNGSPLPGYLVLQYLSSLVFLAVVLVVLWQLPDRSQVYKPWAWYRFWGTLSLVTLMVFLVRIALRTRPMYTDDLIMSFMGGGMFGLVVAASVYWFLQQKLETKQADS